MPYFSIIVPVYNRLGEVRDLLESLSKQTDKDFETVLVEDGSTERCEPAVREFESQVDVKYFYKENEGRSIARNYGMERASGEYFLFFDSDCVIPEHYIATLKAALKANYTDCFGGPDAAHSSFSDIQKAINYSMTSFLTTGGAERCSWRNLYPAHLIWDFHVVFGKRWAVSVKCFPKTST